MGADTDDIVQYSVWHHFLEIPVLGRDDHVSWHDDADGNLVRDHMDEESV